MTLQNLSQIHAQKVRQLFGGSCYSEFILAIEKDLQNSKEAVMTNRTATDDRISVLQDEVHSLAITKGWYNEPRGVPEMLCLIHSEISEALEAYRNYDGDYAFAEELADAVIRIMDLCGHLDIDLSEHIIAKHKKNKDRPYRHGGKRC